MCLFVSLHTKKLIYIKAIVSRRYLENKVQWANLDTIQKSYFPTASQTMQDN